VSWKIAVEDLNGKVLREAAEDTDVAA